MKKSVLTPQEEKQRSIAARWSLSIGLILLVLKFWAYNITDSQAIFSDATESIINVVAAALALFVIHYATKPADKDHPYGHGKLEFFSAAFEGGLITFAGGFIIIDAAKALLEQEPLHQLGFGLLIVAGAGLVNLLLGLYLMKVGRKNKSEALKASGRHVLSDFWTSFGVVIGLGLVSLTGYFWLDPAIAIVVGAQLMWGGFQVVRTSVSGLMDEEDVQLLRELQQIFEKTVGDGIIQIHHVKMIRSGLYHHIDAHLVLPQFWDVSKVHEEVTAFENRVLEHYDYSGEMNFHIDPCRQAYCRHCPLANCPIRKEEFEERWPVRLADLRSTKEPKNFRS